MQKKALIVATVGRFLSFEKNNIRLLWEAGYTVHCATNFGRESGVDTVPDLDAVRHQIDFSRAPFSGTNVRAYRQLRALLMS